MTIEGTHIHSHFDCSPPNFFVMNLPYTHTRSDLPRTLPHDGWGGSWMTPLPPTHQATHRYNGYQEAVWTPQLRHLQNRTIVQLPDGARLSMLHHHARVGLQGGGWCIFFAPPCDRRIPVSHSLNQLRTPHEVGGGLAIVSAGKEMDVSANTTDNLPQQQPTTGHTCHFQRNKQTNKQTNEQTWI
jgi:hypothetical protein